MSHDFDRVIAGKAFACGIQHGGRKINRHRGRVGMSQFDQGKQASVSGAEIEDALGRLEG